MASTSSLSEIRVPGRHLCGLTGQGTLLWFSDAELEEIIGVDSESGQVVRRIKCPEVRTGLTMFNGNLLQVVGSSRGLRLIDPNTGKMIQAFPNPRPGLELCGIEATSTGVWLGYSDPPVLEFRDLAQFELLDRIPVMEAVAGVTVTSRHVAYSSFETAHIHLIDPATKEIVATMNVKGNPTGLTWDGHRLWYCDYTNLRLRSIELPQGVAVRIGS
jgi:hypothetical protein